MASYARMMESPDSRVRARAAIAWTAWEDAVISLEPGGSPDAYGGRPTRARLAFVRICTHYFSHGAWLEEDELLRRAGRLGGISGVLIHGRHDMAAPLGTAWELARAWPDAELLIVEDSGHTASSTSRAHVLSALDAFSR